MPKIVSPRNPMSKFEVTLHDRENKEDAKDILAGLQSHNARFAGFRDYRDLTITFRDPETKKLMGGLAGYTQWKWLFVNRLWVSDETRGTGLGKKILAMAEAEGVKRGCVGVWLDTFSFQAPNFYEKLGYVRFGEIKEYPPGFSRYFYSKKLAL